MKSNFSIWFKLVFVLIIFLSFQSLGQVNVEKMPFSKNLIQEKQANVNSTITNFMTEGKMNTKDTDGIIINSNNDFSLYTTIGNGTKENPFVIENISFTGYNSVPAIEIQNTNKYFILREITVGAWSIGIDLFNVKNGLLEDNLIFYSHYGILINQTSNTILMNNTIYTGTSDGIILDRASYNTLDSNKVIFDHTIYSRRFFMYGLVIDNSPQNKIINNNLTYAGISIAGSLNTLEQVEFKNNTIGGTPILFYQNEVNKNITTSTRQIILINCSYFTIKDQILYEVPFGIALFYSSYNILKNNQIFGSTYGFLIQNSDNNLFSNNSISVDDLGSQTLYNTGFYFLSSNKNTIENNSVKAVLYGIYFVDSNNNIVKDNSISIMLKGSNDGKCYATVLSINKFTSNSCNVPSTNDWVQFSLMISGVMVVFILAISLVFFIKEIFTKNSSKKDPK